MKTVPLQLLTVHLENGKRGVFIGVPLVTGESTDTESQVDEIWFSDIREIPEETSVAKLLRLIAEQVCRCYATLQ